MTNEFRTYVLKNVPTKILLRQYKIFGRRWKQDPEKIKEAIYQAIVNGNKQMYLDVIDKWERDWEAMVWIEVGKFAHWNPYKGHGCDCWYTAAEVKAELDKREHINHK